ncbi:MAG: hypothetical protein ACOC58_04340 [Chloroflexota bacterium]
MGESAVRLAELCSLPHVLDDELACKLAETFVNTNGNARSLVARLKALPFVYPYEAERWHLAVSARTYFGERLKQRNGTYLDLNRFLKEYLEHTRASMADSDSPEARETDWRIAYHLAPIDAPAAISRLHDMEELAVARHSLADMKSLVDIRREQESCFSEYQLDFLYFEGHYYYAAGDLPSAEKAFASVWDNAAPSRMKAIAGHLLGVIWMRLARPRASISNAVDVFRQSLEILGSLRDRHGEAMVLNSLGGALMRLGGRDNLTEAIEAFRRSLELGETLGYDRHVAMALNSLGGALVRLGGRDNLTEATEAFRRSLELGETLGYDHHVAMVLYSLGGALIALGDSHALQEAQSLLERSMKINKRLDDRRGQAIVLDRLSQLAEARADLPLASRYAGEALAVWEALRYTRKAADARRRLQRLSQYE